MIEEKTSPREWASLLRISKSHIQTYLMCPRKFYFQYVIALPWEFVPSSLTFGRALHEAAAFFYKTMQRSHEKPDLDSVIAEFAAAWHKETATESIAFADGSSKESLLGLGSALLRSFYEEVRPRTIEAVEYPFSVPLY